MTARVATVGSAGIICALAVVAVRNAFTYPAIGGYDAQEYISYANDLVTRWVLPVEGVYHTPPGFPLVAGGAVALGRTLNLAEPEHLGQLVGALAVALTALILLFLARTLWPSRPLLWLAAVAFFAFIPVVLKAGAMFHPEPLGMLVATGALFLLARMVRTGRYGWQLAMPLGVLLGTGQLIRGWALWMVAVAVLVLGAAALSDRARRRVVVGALAWVVVLAVVIPAPWYVQQATRHSNPVFNREQPDGFLLTRRPLSFYLDARVPDVVTTPWTTRLSDNFVPVLYVETWGDYFGIWEWGPGRGDRTDAIDARLSRQSALGLLPSAVALAGLLALLGLALTRPREDPGRLVAALPPVAALASILFLAVAYPSGDGDTIKGTYALAAMPSLALCFGFAFDVLARRRAVGIVLGGALVISALAMLPFLIW